MKKYMVADLMKEAGIQVCSPNNRDACNEYDQHLGEYGIAQLDTMGEAHYVFDFDQDGYYVEIYFDKDGKSAEYFLSGQEMRDLIDGGQEYYNTQIRLIDRNYWPVRHPDPVPGQKKSILSPKRPSNYRVQSS